MEEAQNWESFPVPPPRSQCEALDQPPRPILTSIFFVFNLLLQYYIRFHLPIYSVFLFSSPAPPPALILRVGGAGEFKILLSVAGPSNIKAGGVGGSLFNALLQFSSPCTLSHRTQARLDRKRQKKTKVSFDRTCRDQRQGLIEMFSQAISSGDVMHNGVT